MSIGCRSPHWRSPNVVYVRSSRMAFELLPLPFSRDALAPHMSGETLDFHHGKHHKAYVDKVNGWIEEKDLRGSSLVEVIRLALDKGDKRSEEHTSELQSLMRISYAVFCLKKKNKIKHTIPQHYE